MWIVPHGTLPTKSMKYIFIDAENCIIRAIYIIPRSKEEILKSFLQYAHYCTKQVRVGKRDMLMFFIPQDKHSPNFSYGFSTDADLPMKGNAFLIPLSSRGTLQSVGVHERYFLSSVNQFTRILRKQLDWYPYDLEDESSDINYSWQLRPNSIQEVR
jgi:hypothetical protein